MFSKKQEHSSPTMAPRAMANSGSTFSIIGPDVTIRGDIEANADLHIDGVVEGDVNCTSLVQGEGSRVEGAIRAESARLSGHVKGTIQARELVVLKSARVEGDVSYETLTIEQGAAVDGRFAPKSAAPAQAPAKADGKGDDGEPKLHLAG